MSSTFDTIKQLILAYLKLNFTAAQIAVIQAELNIVFYNLSTYQCYILTPSNSNLIINGLDVNLPVISSSFLIPNLFRKCYLLDDLYIPNICNTFVSNLINYNFRPLIIDEKLIKAFLYFNYPVNIAFYSEIDSYVNKIINIESVITNIIKKKKNTTYGSYSLPPSIYSQIYLKSSMLTQLMAWNRFIGESSTINTNGLTVEDYTVFWEFTTKCTCFTSDIINDTYLEGNFNYNYKVSNSAAVYINRVSNFLKQAGFLEYSTSAATKLIIYNSFSTISIIAKEVYQDIIMQIQYYIKNEYYCKKDYMNISIIPELNTLYNNFYNNQIKAYYNSLPNTDINDTIPTTISLTNYFNKFNTYYLTTYTTRYLVKNIILNGLSGNDSIAVYSNVKNWSIASVVVIYYYYYINKTYPSAVELTNKNSILPSGASTYTSVTAFTTVFNNEFKTYSGSSTYKLVSTYTSEGLYPKGGTTTDSQNIGYTYNFLNSKNKIVYSVYETLESYAPYDPATEINAKGVGLVYNTFV